MQIFSIQTLRAQILWANSPLKGKVKLWLQKLHDAMQCVNVCGCANFKAYSLRLFFIDRHIFIFIVNSLHVCPDRLLNWILGVIKIFHVLISFIYIYKYTPVKGWAENLCMHELWLLYGNSCGKFQHVSTACVFACFLQQPCIENQSKVEFVKDKVAGECKDLENEEVINYKDALAELVKAVSIAHAVGKGPTDFEWEPYLERVRMTTLLNLSHGIFANLYMLQLTQKSQKHKSIPKCR